MLGELKIWAFNVPLIELDGPLIPNWASACPCDLDLGRIPALTIGELPGSDGISGGVANSASERGRRTCWANIVWFAMPTAKTNDRAFAHRFLNRIIAPKGSWFEFFLNARLESVKTTSDALEMIELTAGRMVAPR